MIQITRDMHFGDPGMPSGTSDPWTVRALNYLRMSNGLARHLFQS